MGNLQVKNLPAGLHDELRRRADQQGITQREYVLGLIRADLALPSRQDWLDELERLPRVSGGPSGADAVEAARAERDRDLRDAGLRRRGDR